ncbi:MAG TPA: DUF29 domain-containing protein [Telluria sp.]|nr:DUF29 domain-containing protein [Telluria sp.]
MDTLYDTDFAAWAYEQAELLRAGDLAVIDACNIAEEIEGVARSEQRELGSRLAVLLAHLLKWWFQPGRRGKSWRQTIKTQRYSITHALRRMPSLKHFLKDEEWLSTVWEDALDAAVKETNLSFPSQNPWTLSEVLDPDFFPD